MVVVVYDWEQSLTTSHKATDIIQEKTVKETRYCCSPSCFFNALGVVSFCNNYMWWLEISHCWGGGFVRNEILVCL